MKFEILVLEGLKICIKYIISREKAGLRSTGNYSHHEIEDKVEPLAMYLSLIDEYVEYELPKIKGD